MGLTVMLVLVATLAQAPATVRVERIRSLDDANAVSALIELHSDLRKRLRFVKARLLLDGVEIVHRVAPTGQELEDSFRASAGKMKPGPYTLTVALEYEGRNTGLFTYLDGYRFKLESSANFTVREMMSASPATIYVFVYERPGAGVPLEKKLTIEIKAASPSPISASTNAPAPRDGR